MNLTGNVVYDATNNPLPAAIGGAGTLQIGGATSFTVGASTAGSAGPIVSNPDLVVSSIVSGGGITKNGAGWLNLSNAANSFTGAVALNAGKLQLASSGVTSSITVAGGVDAASAPTLILSSQNLGSGSAYTTGNLTLGNNANLVMTLGATANAANPLLTVNGTVTLPGSPANPVHLSLNRGAGFDLGSTLTQYTLISAPGGGLSGAANNLFTLPANSGGFIYTLSDSANSLILNAQYFTGALYWKGTASDTRWSTVVPSAGIPSNWASDSAGTTVVATSPGVDNDVVFAASASPSNPAASVVDTNFSIKSLTISDPATTAITGTNSATLTIGSGGLTLTSGAAFTFGSTTGTVNLALLGSTLITNANAAGAGGLLTIQNGIVSATGASTLTFTGAGDIVVNGVMSNGGGTLGLQKSGPGTLTLNAANTYSGNTTIARGNLVIGVNDALPTTGTLRLGLASVSAANSFNLNGFNQTIGGLIVSTTSSAVTNTLVIPTASTLTVNGAVTIGHAGAGTTKLTTTGGGSLVVNYTGTAGAGFVLGVSAGTAYNPADVDLSKLTNFTADLGANGLLAVGDSLAGASSGASSTLTLAVNNFIVADQIRIGDASGPSTANNVLTLGSGTNVLHVDQINVSGVTGFGYRSSGTLRFAPADVTGTLLLRGNTGGDSRSAMNLIAQVGVGNTGTLTADALFAGHDVDARFSTLTMASSQANGPRVANLTFDRGLLDVETWIVGSRNGSGSVGGATTATVSLGQSGGPAIVHVGSMILGQNTNSNAGNTVHAVNAMLNISGGSVTVGNLLMAQAGSAGRIINSTINLSGGTLSLSSSLVRSGIGVENTSLSLNGGTLDMNGNDIGSLSALIGSGTGSVSLLSGTIRNLGEFNGGAALVKTGTGTLIFAGTNAYTGTTVISGGTLQVGTGASGSIASQTVINNGALVFNRSNAYAYAGQISGTGSVAVTGGGSVTLAGGNTYTGATSVAAGTLNVNGTLGSTAVAVAGGATLAGTGTIGGVVTSLGAIAPGTLGTVGTLTLGGLILDGGSLNFDLASTLASDRLWLNGGSFNLTASTGLNLNSLSGFGAGTYDLIGGFSGAIGGFGFLSAPSTLLGYNLTLTDAGGILRLFVTGTGGGGPQNIVWTGSSDALWNTTSANWTGSASLYTDGDNVTFNDTSSVKTLTIASPVAPGSIVVDTNTSYTFLGAAITGTTSLWKQGSGTLTLAGSHAFTGPTTVQSGVLQLRGDYASSIQLQNALLQLSTTGNQTLTGLIAGTGFLQKLGTGTTTLLGVNTFSGITSIDAGTLVVNHALSGTVFVNAGGSFTGTGASTSQIVVQGGSGSISGTQSGAINLANGSLSIENGGLTTGAVSIGGGLLTIESGGRVGNTLGINVTGGTLDVQTGGQIVGNGQINVAGTLIANGDVQGTVTVNSGGVLHGNGSVGAIVLQNGGTLSVGNSVGSLTIDGDNAGGPSLTLNAGSIIEFEFNDVDAGPGVGWDYVELGAGLLTINAQNQAGGDDRVLVHINSLTLANAHGANDFNAAAATPSTVQEYYWKFIGLNDLSQISTTGPSSLSGRFHVVDDLVGAGVFDLADGNPYDRPINHLGQGTFKVLAGDFGQGNGLYIYYSAVPEPGSMLLAGLGSLAAGWYGRRKLRRKQNDAAAVSESAV